MSINSNTSDWIAIDWAPQRQRAWLISQSGDVIDRSEQNGAANDVDITVKIVPLIESWLKDDTPIDVLFCGAGASNAQSTPVPCKPMGGARLTPQTSSDPRVNVVALGAISQAKPLDILQEQTAQIAGYIAQFPKFDGVLVLAGTHTKWVRVSAEEVVSFESYLSGQMLDLLSNQYGLAACDWTEANFDSFCAAVDDVRSKPEKLAARLYDVQMNAANAVDADTGLYERLAGILIGAEVTSARPYWLGQDVVLLGGHGLEAAYLKALAEQGAMVRCAELTDTSLLGLAACRKMQIEKEE